MLEQGTVDN